MVNHAHDSHLFDTDDSVIETVEQVVAVLISTQIPVASFALRKVSRFGGDKQTRPLITPWMSGLCLLDDSGGFSGELREFDEFREFAILPV